MTEKTASPGALARLAELLQAAEKRKSTAQLLAEIVLGSAPCSSPSPASEIV
jgi:hypothetical protein